MNEIFFFSHIFIVVGFTLIALRLGSSALIAFIALQGVLANLFVVKQTTLFCFGVTCSDVFAISGILSLNLLQEYFGKEKAKLAVRISLFTLLFFALMSQMHLFYTPNLFDTTHGAFQAIFASTFRIVVASIGTFYVVQQVDVRIFPLFKGSLPLRVTCSLLCSQLLDTILFSFFGLYGIVQSLFDVIALSFFIKGLIIAISSPFVVFAKRFVSKNVQI